MPTFPPPVRTQRNAVPEKLPCTVLIYAVTYRSKQFEASSPQAKMEQFEKRLHSGGESIYKTIIKIYQICFQPIKIQ